jgi:hypothetical protein
MERAPGFGRALVFLWFIFFVVERGGGAGLPACESVEICGGDVGFCLEDVDSKQSQKAGTSSSTTSSSTAMFMDSPSFLKPSFQSGER